MVHSLSNPMLYIKSHKRAIVSLTLYSTMQTKMFRGMRKKFMIVLLASSGMYWDLIFMIDGQNIPTQASNAQKPTTRIHPEKEILPPFTLEGAIKNCSEIPKKLIIPSSVSTVNQFLAKENI